jgi:hypothetical protein
MAVLLVAALVLTRVTGGSDVSIDVSSGAPPPTTAVASSAVVASTAPDVATTAAPDAGATTDVPSSSIAPDATAVPGPAAPTVTAATSARRSNQNGHADTTAVTAPPGPVETTTTLDQTAFDRLVTISTRPSSTVLTLHDRVTFDVTIHNGLAEPIHAEVAGCNLLMSSDPLVSAVGFGGWDGTPEGLLSMIDGRVGSTTVQRAVELGAPSGPFALGAGVTCPTLEIPAGTDVHKTMQWDVGVGEIPFAGSVFGRSSLFYWPSSADAFHPAYVYGPTFELTIVDDPLRASSRSAAAAAALADGRFPALQADALGGGFYHDGRWVFDVYPSRSLDAHGYRVTVDAATATVVGFAVSPS